jgi:hypothetical protein
MSGIADMLYEQYGYSPSKSVISKWIRKYTNLAVINFKDDIPETGKLWLVYGINVALHCIRKAWVYIVVDLQTRYLLASRLVFSMQSDEVKIVIHEAKRKAGKMPDRVITNIHSSLKEKLKPSLQFDTEQKKINLLVNDGYDFNSIVKYYHAKLRDRVDNISAFKYPQGLIHYIEGWTIDYNYFKPLKSLNGKTPAEAAGIKYDVKSWADVVRVPVAKPVKSH